MSPVDFFLLSSAIFMARAIPASWALYIGLFFSACASGALVWKIGKAGLL